MKTLKQQNKNLRKYFDFEIPLEETMELPPPGTEYALIPSWTRLGKTYTEALEKLFIALKEERKFYNWRENEMDNFRQTEQKEKLTMPEILPVQLGIKWKGKSVSEVRKNYTKDEIGLGAYEVGMILLLNDDILTKNEDLWIDCPGDEYHIPESLVRFAGSPCFDFVDGGVGFGTRRVAYACGRYGSASGFFPQSNLESRNLDAVESLTLESAIKMVKDAGYIIYKEV